MCSFVSSSTRNRSLMGDQKIWSRPNVLRGAIFIFIFFYSEPNPTTPNERPQGAASLRPRPLPISEIGHKSTGALPACGDPIPDPGFIPPAVCCDLALVPLCARGNSTEGQVVQLGVRTTCWSRDVVGVGDTSSCSFKKQREPGVISQP
jgi:hypothetical protein